MNFIQQNYANSKDAASSFNQMEAQYDSQIEQALYNRGSYDGNRGSMYGGFVNLENQDSNGQDFDLYREKIQEGNYAQEALTNIHTDSRLGYVYFSKENKDLLQDSIRYQVYEQSGRQHVIGKQSDRELQIIMRSYYLTYAKNQDTNIKEQVAILNEMVINECVRIIMPAVEQYLSYLVNIQGNPVPLEHSVNVSQAGSRTLQPNHWL
jgi:hypothetical protein